MKNGKKMLTAILSAFAIALFLGITNSYAFTVKDGEEVLESPDGYRWIQRSGRYYDGRFVIANIFEGARATDSLSVELSAEDLKNNLQSDLFSGEIKFFLFVDNTSIFAELTKEDDAIILKDNTCVLTNTGTEIDSADIRGGDYDPYEGMSVSGNGESGLSSIADLLLFFSHSYRDTYNKMLVTYKPVEAPPAENGETPAAPEAPAVSSPEEPLAQEPETSTETPEPQTETPAPQVTEPQSQPETAPTPEAEEPAAEIQEEQKEIKEAKTSVQTVKEEKETEPAQSAKVTEPQTPKRTETTIIGEELKYKVAATVPTGVDERTVSKFQKQISDALDDLLQEISDNPAEAQEKVSYQTYQKIEQAISEGKTISAEAVVEKIDAESIPPRDVETFTLVVAENEGAGLKIGKYFDISIMIMADNSEELGTYNEMSGTITFTIPTPKDVPCPEGMEYVIIRAHNGQSTIIPVIVNKDGTLSFETDKFSTYALAVREVMDEEVAKASNIDSSDALDKEDDIMDFAKWFLRILVLAFGSGTLVILLGIHEKRKNK